MTATNELREKLEWFRADLCNVGCAIECATWEKRKALIDGVIDEYAQAIADMFERGTCQVTMRWVEWEDADGTPRRYRTSHYDTTCGNELFWPGKLPPYCPYCGKRVERR